MPDTAFSSIAAGLQRALPAASRGWLRKRGPLLAFLGLLILAAWLAAKLTWQFASGPPSASAAATGRAPAEHAGRGISTDRIVAAHLFGVATAQESTVAAENAPETSLNLTLIGVAAGKNGGPSQAIIASGSRGDEKTYSIGDAIPGGAVIRQILPDRVILAHNGRLEALRLPVVGTSLLAANMQFGQPGTVPGPGSSQLRGAQGTRLEQMRREVESHPQSFSRFMRLSPDWQNGHLRGYRVYPSDFPELFRRAGLQPGDIVTSINGVRLNSVKGSMKAIGQLRNAKGSVRLKLLRQGKPVSVTVSFPGG